MIGSKLLAGKCTGNHVFTCPSGRVHLVYGDVELRFCREEFAKLLETSLVAISRMYHEPETTEIRINCGYIALRVSRQAAVELRTLLAKARMNLLGTFDFSKTLN